jgi:hypothetical protein
VEANSTGGQGSRRAVAQSDDNDYDYLCGSCDTLLTFHFHILIMVK